jgi:hypothetical protein
VEYGSGPASSTINRSRWVHGFYCNIISSNHAGNDSLCRFDFAKHRQEGVHTPEYYALYVEALRAFWNGEPSVIDIAMASLQASDPNRDDVSNPSWMLSLNVPQLELLIRSVSGSGEEFDRALAGAVRSHQEYWSATKTRRADDRGYASVELTGLALLGINRGKQIGFTSDYFLSADLSR